MNNIVVKHLLNGDEDKSQVWFTVAQKPLLDFLDSVLLFANNNGNFSLMTPYLIVRHTMILAELYTSDNQPVFPPKQVFPDANIPSGFVSSLTNDEYRERWNKLPTNLKKALFELALEANPQVRELVDKYGESQLGLGGNPVSD